MIEREFRVGDKVTCVLFGKGDITYIGDELLRVKFDKGNIECYYLSGKYIEAMNRTLFIIPKQKPTNEEILNKFNELVNNTAEVCFIPNEKNYYVEGCFYCEENKYVFNKSFNKTIKFLRTKYISETKVDSILIEINNFIKGE